MNPQSGGLASSIRGMRRLAALPIAVFAGFAGPLLQQDAAARAATGGCSVASAPTIQSGQTQTSNPNACPDGLQYWAMSLKIGDTLNVDIAPKAPPGNFGHYELHVYGPNVGTIGQPLCGNAYSSPSRESCLVPAAGRYVLVTSGPGSFTPNVKSVPAHPGRVAGSCDPANAPAAPSRVTQYVNTNVCQPSGTTQYWRIVLDRGDRLNVNVAPFGGSIFVHLYRSVGSLGNPLCGNGYSSPAAFSCPIRGSGRYVLAAENAGSFTPLVIRPTRTVVVAPGFVKGGGAIAISAVIRSNAPNPTGTCIVQEQSGGRWLTDARVHTSTGTCHARVVPRHRDKVRLRVHFKGAKGWASSTSKPVTVGVG